MIYDFRRAGRGARGLVTGVVHVRLAHFSKMSRWSRSASLHGMQAYGSVESRYLKFTLSSIAYVVF